MFRIMFLLILFTVSAHAESVDVKYRGKIDLKHFQCQNITRSSFINRVCYDAPNKYMIILLKSTYYPYCELPQSVLTAFLAADSMGRYYNSNIKGSSSDGPYDCRTHKSPAY